MKHSLARVPRGSPSTSARRALPPEVRDQLVRLSIDDSLSEEFREACRAELGDRG